MKLSYKTGFSFGLTSGIITTLGLIVGLNAGTHSRTAIIGGILTIAIADAFSDALGIHISQESQNKYTERSVWESTAATFLTKLVFALSFIGPILLFDLPKAIIISVVWGFSALSLFSYLIAKQQKGSVWKVVTEHFIIGLIVVSTTQVVGMLIKTVFN
ncbi:hypothetical protein A2363_01385 [Candidatus Gottesmanbacteria bacterium RIFOXYB1_FULL_47_11]|uniref:VIT family protein n=1 Tax=Candidatus Gottesmanbacteria bacterium RIFOXYB1_FULL_47_11 TaxID=1798401 RepID=A0A1F6BEA3_9BACT|nr:MAG: hypothetical protein A2363_01385 [Candidatus Gottesmanbacteria bacterium RIFOXYB1_FULL_47_11]